MICRLKRLTRIAAFSVATLATSIVFAQTSIQPLPAQQSVGAFGTSQPSYLPPPPDTYPSIQSGQPPTTSAYNGYTVPSYPLTGPESATYSTPQAANQLPVGSPYATTAYNNYNPPQPFADSPASAPVGAGAMPNSGSMPSPSDVYASETPMPSQSFDSEPEYRWYHYPWAWIPRDGWESSVEFGLNGSEGNANSLSYAAGADISRQSDIYNLTFNLDHRRTQSGAIDTQNNARANLDFDRAIAESKFASFIKSGLEYDEFKAFDARVNVNGGFSYLFAKSDEFTFITRFGAGASSEIGSVDEEWKPEALFGLESKRQINDRNRIFIKIDYFPAFEDFGDYRIVTDASWEILLSDSENFSLKLSALNRYDSTPLGLEPQDIDYAATLLYKF